MTETRPAPLVPADTDLRSFPWLPLPVNFISATDWLCASPAGRAAMTSLAVASWHQIPAASLPMNDAALASLAQSGQKWRHIKREALAGWIECSDGRLYHPALAKNAVESMAKKQAQTHRTEAARLARLAKNSSVTSSVTESTRQDRTRHLKEHSFAMKEKGCRLAADWQPSDEDRAHATRLDLNVDRTAADFRDYYAAKAGKDGVRADWSATWRRWCRTKADKGETLSAASDKSRPSWAV